MTPLLSEMDLPDEVVEKVAKAIKARISIIPANNPSYISAGPETLRNIMRDSLLQKIADEAAKAAIRAALQAMCDCGMAEVREGIGGGTIIHGRYCSRFVIINADERNRKEQK